MPFHVELRAPTCQTAVRRQTGVRGGRSVPSAALSSAAAPVGELVQLRLVVVREPPPAPVVELGGAGRTQQARPTFGASLVRAARSRAQYDLRATRVAPPAGQPSWGKCALVERGWGYRVRVIEGEGEDEGE